MNRKIVFSEGEYYHVYNRGVEKRSIFLDSADSLHFQSLLYLCNGSKPTVYRLIQGPTLYQTDVGARITAIGSYVLMPNHFHILLKETKENGISEFMQKLTTAYVMYFNKKHDRVGPLFQGKFKALHVNRDEQLKYLFAYFYLNPLKIINPSWKDKPTADMEKSEKFLSSYHISSAVDYGGVGRQQEVILSKQVFPEYFSEPRSFQEYVNDWLAYSEDTRSDLG